MVKAEKSYSWIKLIAVLLLITGGAWLYYSQFSKQEVQFVTQQQVQLDTLSDGTVVTLNKRSLLRYPHRFEAEKRQVWLTKGEAFFQVKAVTGASFFVTVASTTIQTDSGSFNVRKLGGRVEVISETARLNLSRNGKEIILKPGELSILKQNNSELTKENNTDQLYTYYRNNQFITKDTPLPKLVKALNESFGSTIIIRRKKLNKLKLTAVYQGNSLDDILKSLTKQYRISIERKQNKIFLY